MFEHLTEEPAWHRALPQHCKFTDSGLIKDLEHLRTELGLNDEQFTMVYLHSRTLVVHNLHLLYHDARRKLPNRPERDYFGIVIGERIIKKIQAYPINTSAFALPPQELERIAEDVDSVVAQCSTFNDVIEFLMHVETREHRFDDPFGYISRFDALVWRKAGL